MTQEDVEIGEQLRRITHNDRTQTWPMMSGKVVAGSLDAANGYCQVLLTGMVDDNGDGGGNDVLLNPVSVNNNGVVLYPADGSDVIVGEIDGSGNYCLIRASDLEKVSVIVGGSSITVTDGLIQLNDGSLGGLPVLQKIVDNQNKILNYLTGTLQPAIANAMAAIGAGSAANGATGAATFNSAMAGQTIEWEDMENTKITQG
jgi:hypothetical protein